MKTVSESIFKTSKSDEEIQMRIDLLGYLDASLYQKNEYLFYNLLEYMNFHENITVRGFQPKGWINPEGIISLTYPNNPPNDDQLWEFVYCHECLHSIYDTFGVYDMIKEELGSCDMTLLNIASDCVINETLIYRFRKNHFYVKENFITAQYIYKTYGVDYNIMKDTQYTMYKKLLEEVQNNPEKYQQMQNDNRIQEEGSKHQEHGSSANNKGGEQGKQGESEGGDTGGQQSGEGQGQKQSSGKGEKSDDEKGEGAQGESGKEGDDKESDKGEKKLPWSDGKFKGYSELLDYYNAPSEYSLRELIDKAKNTLTGPIGEFIEKIKKIPIQIKNDKYGITLETDDGSRSDYMKSMFNKTRAILSNKLNNIRREYELSYSRINRRHATPTRDGGFLKKGKKEIRNKVTLNLTFYVDISGSMYGNVDKIFENLYANAGPLVDQYKNIFKDVLADIVFDYYAFNEKIHPVKKGAIPTASGGNIPLHELLKYMQKHTNMSAVNILITDAGFDVNNDAIIKETENFDGHMIIIFNSKESWKDYTKIESQSKGKIIPIFTQSF